MGNHRFKLSNMMPNAWFYKLRDMAGKGKSSNSQTRRPPLPPPLPPSLSKTKQPPPPVPQSCSRKSYYFTREIEGNDGFCPEEAFYFPEPPRKSSKQQKYGGRRRRKTATGTATARTKLVSTAVCTGCNCPTTAESIYTKSDSPPEFSTSPLDSSSETFDNDIIIDIDKESLIPSITKPKNHDDVGGSGSREFDCLTTELKLPPIITKRGKVTETKVAKQRKLAANSGGVKLRGHSPKVGNKKMKQFSGGRQSVSGSRRSLSESLAIMKSSNDPQRDFKESMVEMIVENNIRESKDLEDLLACYLCLNADEYHGLIIKVFKQIWFDLSQKM